MKKILFTTIAILSMALLFAQNNVGIGTTTPAASAALDISSTNRGLLIPRMTSAQRAAIATPAKGLMVFDNETNSFWYYNGSEWTSLSGSTGLSLPYQQSVASNTYVFDITNTGTGGALSGAVKGVSTSVGGVGVYGLANSTGGAGLKGESNQGIGVYGYSGTKQAIYGSAISGTALFGTSAAGYALETVGNIKISGGNTNPTNGAVLTSDANGNATWKKQNIGFAAKRNISQNLPYGLSRLIFDVAYDAGNGFHSNGSATNPNIFVAPVSGYYYFSASAHLRIYSPTTNIFDATLIITEVGASSGLIYGIANQAINDPGWSTAFVQAHGGAHLNAGAKIEVLALANNNGNLPATSLGSQFSGHLVFPD